MSSHKIILSSVALLSVATILFSTESHAQNYKSSPTDYPSPSGPQNQAPPSTAVPGQYSNSDQDWSYNGNAQPAQAPSAQTYQTERYQAPTIPTPAPQIYPATPDQPVIYPVTPQTAQAPVIYPTTPVVPDVQNPNPSSVTTYTSGPIYKTADGSTYSDMPRYSYDPRLDPRQNPVPKPPPAPDSKENPRYRPYMDLLTHSGIEVTAQAGYYEYEEPDFGVDSTGALFSGNVAGTLAFRKWFATIEGRYGYVSADYSSSSGQASGQPTDTLEYRALIGRDIPAETYDISPYIGFGYRSLANDARGTTDIGAHGYRRFNQLYYVPIGIHPRTHIDSESRLTATLEYDYVIHGLQKTDLSDAGLGDPNFKNGQNSGYAIRGDIMYETHAGWSFGPYLTYWNISNSKIKTLMDSSASTCSPSPTPCVAGFLEPFNTTLDVGVQLRYHFF